MREGFILGGLLFVVWLAMFGLFTLLDWPPSCG